MVKTRYKKQKSRARLRHLMSTEDELNDDNGFGDEETLVDSKVGVGDDGVKLEAINDINLKAGTNTNIVTGASDNNNTAIQQTSNTFEVTVSGPEVVAGRRLLQAERQVSLLRLDASGGIRMESVAGMTVQAESLQVTGPLAATSGLEVTGTMVANDGLAVTGALVANTGLEVTGNLVANTGLAVTGALVANTGLEVTGNLALAGNLEIPSSKCSFLDINTRTLIVIELAAVAGQLHRCVAHAYVDDTADAAASELPTDDIALLKP
jgi:hypothetical protein